MCDQTKKGSNTVEQLIGNMTADLQNSDGQYIQLGFTPPPTPNDPHIWSEYANPNPIPQNPFVPHYSPRNPDSLAYQHDTNNRYVSPPVSYNNYIPQNQMFVPEISNNAYEKHLNLHGGKILFCSGQSPQYLVQNQQDLSMYMQCYPENRDRAMFVNSEMNLQQLQQQQMQQSQTSSNNTNDPCLFAENVLMQQQNHQEVLKNKLLMQQTLQPTQNRTPLIENLMGNWAPNQNGTYSPFGNVPTQNPQNYFLKPQELNSQPAQISPQIVAEPMLSPVDQERIQNEYSPKNFPISTNKTAIKKQKQVAEVRPMRPTYSDVLAKSVPAQTLPKPDKVEPKSKNQTTNKKSGKNSDKFSKIALNRQTSTNSSDNTAVNGHKNTDKPQSDQKVNLSRKWVSLDDVNEVNQSNDFLNSDLNDSSTNGAKIKKTNKKLDSNGTNSTKNESTPTNITKNPIKKTFHDNNSLGCQWTESEEFNDNSKNDEKINKNPSKKAKEIRSNSGRQNRFDRSSSEKPPGSAKRSQRIRRKDNYSALSKSRLFGRNVQHYVSRWSKVIFSFIMWLFHLISDIFTMSLHLGRDLCKLLWDSILINSKSLSQNTMTLLKRVKIFTKFASYIDKTFGETRWAFWNRGEKERKNSKVEGQKFLNSGLEHNISMPTTGEEAMKRLLACKGKDPYSILGVRPDCTDDDIKRYYKRQAFLVHPDKNPQPGAEEAFKILVHAFDIIGEPERRQSYDRKVAESHQVEQAWSELNDLLSQLHQKMEYAANTIRCTNCTKRHRRVSVDRPCYAARMCQQCRIHHSAKEGDIWAEASYFGFLWHYYACMDGAVYDITEWAGCQRKNLKHLRPNSHNVQYRIVLGKQGGQPGGSGVSGGAAGATHGRRHGKNGGSGGSASEREADLESFLNNLYSQSDLSAAAGATPPAQEGGGASAARLRKKNKRKK